MLALYRSGNSCLHRMPAGTKLAVLASSGTGLFFVESAAVLAFVLVVVATLYRVASVPLRAGWRALRPAVLMLALLFVMQGLLQSIEAAVVVVLRLIDLLALATLVTLTTRSSATIDVLARLCRPLERIGLSAQRLALMLSLTLRYIPLLHHEYRALAEAALARGGRARMLPLLLPLLVRSLRHADALAEAIDARGFPPGDG